MSTENPYPSHDPASPSPRPEAGPGTRPDEEETARLEDAPETRPGTHSDVEHTTRLEDAPESPQPAAHSATAWQGETHDQEPTRNTFSVTYLVAGLVFLGIAGLWVAQETGAVEVEDLDLLGPLLLVVVGAAGLLAGLARAVRRR